VTAHAKHKKVYKAAKGYYGRRKNTIRVAKQAVEKANQYAFRDRKRRKRTFRALWIQRLNAAVRPFGLNYSKFIDGLGGRAGGRSQLSDPPSTSRPRSRSWRPRPRCRLKRFTLPCRVAAAGERWVPRRINN
jgi:large subunit ribosomal protein L20